MAKYYYNGVLLPEIPADVLAEYPYVWIRKVTTTSQYNLIFSKTGFYFNSGKVYDKNGAKNPAYVCPVSGGTEWTQASYNLKYSDWAISSGVTSALWSNHDIPNGSATATAIYFYSTYPIPEADECYYNGVRLPAIPEDVFAEYPYCWMRGTPLAPASLILLFAKYPWYYSSGKMYCSGGDSVTEPVYQVNASADSWEFLANQTGYWGVDSSRPVLWTNHDIRNGSATSATIYFYGNTPVPVVEEPDIPVIRTSGYLIRSGSTLYTVTGGALAAISETVVSASVFQTYGMDDVPDGALLVGLTDPEVLFWQDSQDDLPDLSLTVTGTPPMPQVITSDPVDLAHESISEIDHVTANASEDVRFSVSFNGGATWLAYDGSGWFQTTETKPGMLASTMNAVTTAQWAEIATMTSCQVRAWLPAVTSYVDSVVFHYINP